MNADEQLLYDANLALGRANHQIKELMLTLEDSMEQITKRDVQVKNLVMSLEAANTHISELEEKHVAWLVETDVDQKKIEQQSNLIHELQDRLDTAADIATSCAEPVDKS
jgi:chromosome segregation ATPase